MSTVKVGTNKGEVYEYVRGTNERLDAIIGDQKVFIVNGARGRVPVVAETEAEAVEVYVARYL